MSRGTIVDNKTDTKLVMEPLRIWSPEGVLLRDLYRLLCHGTMMAVFLGFLGKLVPVGDSLAVFRIELTLLLAVLAVGAFLLGRTLIPMLASVTVTASLFSLLPFVGTGEVIERPDFTIHQHNVYYDNPDFRSLAQKLRETGADVLTMQEISEQNFAKLRLHTEGYLHYQACIYSRGGVAVMARDLGTVLEKGCAKQGRLAWITIDTDHGPVTFASIHLVWPWPKGQFWQQHYFGGDLAELTQPVILGGDFNITPWAQSISAVAEIAQGRVAPGLQPSFSVGWGWPMFRIDNIIVPETAKAHVVVTPSWGSDHKGLSGAISLHSDAKS